MPVYNVINKVSGAEVIRYCSAAIHEEVNGIPYPLADYDHVEYVEDAVAPAPTIRRLTKLQFIERLGADFDTLFEASKTVLAVEKFMKMLDWTTPEADGTSVDLDDLRVVGALQEFEAAGLIGAGRAAEILNGI